MAQRRTAGLARSMLMLLARRFQTEKERPRPAAAGDGLRDCRERAITLAAEQQAVFQDVYLMGGAVPLAQQHGARPDSARGRRARGSTRGAFRGDPLQDPAGSGFEAAESLILQPISDCLYQQRPAEPGRQLGAIEATPTFLQALSIKTTKARELPRQLFRLSLPAPSPGRLYERAKGSRERKAKKAG
jgi:hypothetical protein